MSKVLVKSFAISAVILGGLALLVLPGAARAGDMGNPTPPSGPIVIEPTPTPDLPPSDPTDPPVEINPPPKEDPDECGEIVIQPVPGPCDPADPPVGINPPSTDPPVGTNPPPESGLPPEGRVWQLRLWIQRRGEARRAVVIDCREDCPLARYLLRLSVRPAAGKCRVRRGTVRAGGMWRAQRIGVFHNRNTCAARVWRQAAPIYNRLVG